jgi:multiple sugar transport system substrate-binding protein
VRTVGRNNRSTAVDRTDPDPRSPASVDAEPGSRALEEARMNAKRAFAVVLTLASSAALVTACGSSGGGTGGAAADFGAKPTGTLNAWAFDNADDVGKARVADAGKALNGVTVKLDRTGFDAQKFTTRVAGGNVPDVVQMDRQFVATYAAQDLIMPLDKCYSAHHVSPADRFYKSVMDDVTYKGQVWAVPQFYQPPAIIVNKNVLDAAGVTKDQIDTSKPDVLLAAVAKMYKSSGGRPSVLGLNAIPTGQANLWVIGLGGQLIDKDGKPTLDDRRNVYPLQLLKRITDAQGGWAKDKSFSDSFDVFGAKNPFVKNQVGAEVDNQWYANVLAPYADKINIEAVPFRDRNGKPVTVSGGQAFVIPAKSKNPSAACAWALRLTDEQNWLAAAKARSATLAKDNGINTGLFTGSPAADQKIRQQYVKASGNAGFDQTISTFYDIVGSGRSFGASPAGQTIQSALVNAVTETLLGQKSPQDALKAAQQQAMNSYQNTAH